MAFHSDALNTSDDQLDQVRFVAPIKSAMASAATIGFLALVQPDLTVLASAAAITSLSLTFVSVLQSQENRAKAMPKLDAIYAVLLGMMAMVSFLLAAGSVMLAICLLAGLILSEIVVSSLIAAGVSSLQGMYRAPINVALNIHSRLFGLLGRAA